MSQKILIVDDDELTVRLLSNRLIEEDYEIIIAGNGEDAVKQTIHEKPDVVIMDIMLPDMQGSDAVKTFQESADVSDDIKVVFLSGIISREEEGIGKIQVGSKLYTAVAKPIDFDQLLAFIRS